MKKRICVLFTGGTIGSLKKNSCVAVDQTQNGLLIELAKKEVQDITFDTLSVLDMHSENVQTEDLYKIVESVNCVDTNLYNGIILTHGTDTLSNTSNYLSLVLSLPIPVVLVSSNYPLSDERQNGLDNFLSAVRFIQNTDYAGVFVSYKNINEENKIHLGSRILEARQFDGYVDSFGGEYFGEIKNGKFIANKIPENYCVKNKTWDGVNLCQDIAVIHSHALLDYGIYGFTEKKPKAVIVTTYHSGTVCVKGENTNFLHFAKKCKEKGIEVILAPVDRQANVYESARDLGKVCALSYNQSVGITILKIMLALGQGKDIKSVLDEDFAFEKI